MHWTPAVGNGMHSKFDHARRIAAALSYIALANLDRVNLFSFGAELGEDLGFVRGKRQFHAVLDFLKRLPGRSAVAPDRGTRMRSCFEAFSRRLKRRGLVFVLSDLFDPEAAEALGYLRQQQFEVSALQVLHPEEIDPALSGDVRLVDSETGVAFDVLADNGALTAYRAAFERFTAHLESECRRRAIGLVRTTVAAPFEELVLRVLRERQLVQ